MSFAWMTEKSREGVARVSAFRKLAQASAFYICRRIHSEINGTRCGITRAWTIFLRPPVPNPWPDAEVKLSYPFDSLIVEWVGDYEHPTTWTG